LADENRKPQPFDVGTIRHLVQLMGRYDLSEIDLSEGDQRIRLRRGTRVKNTPVAAPAALPATPPSAQAPTPATTPAAPEKPARNLAEIRSPAVGTFYAQAKPGLPPYVTVGSRVTPTTVVCTIEAMKVFNEITADCSGVIAEICVEDGNAVEYKTVLFRVDPAG
jgi:acetyl-CoA carboxylase biotin carboxyl carrier protein